MCFLAKFYNVPVIKAYGKKNPEIQNTFGVPPSIQSFKNLTLSIKSSNQDARGFRDKNPMSSHD